MRIIKKNINGKAKGKDVYTRSISKIREICYEDLKKMIKNHKNTIIVDIRSPQEYSEKRIRNAINIPFYDLKKIYKEILLDKNKIIILYCEYGIRSKKAYDFLEEKGYKNVYSLKGGIDSVW